MVSDRLVKEMFEFRIAKAMKAVRTADFYERTAILRANCAAETTEKKTICAGVDVGKDYLAVTKRVYAHKRSFLLSAEKVRGSILNKKTWDKADSITRDAANVFIDIGYDQSTVFCFAPPRWVTAKGTACIMDGSELSRGSGGIILTNTQRLKSTIWMHLYHGCFRHTGASEEYIEEMSAEEVNPQGFFINPYERPNHFFDAEVLSMAAYYFYNRNSLQ